ncbi:MAG: DUF4623 domain-containing protein [Prevotellaceae bacterium]|jgi:hypothetical protein|nr:DUF4623 domain-containing protein [Prevotellaceae bacterium]
MKKIITYLSSIILATLLVATVACNNEETYPESPDLTIIYGIKIVNAGAQGDQVLTGTVDEINKEISFPDVDTLTDFSRIRFEAELPERAQLDEEVYNFSMGAADSRLKRTIAVVNGIRKKEYYVTVKKDVPVWGADFDRGKVEVFNFSKNGGGTAYPDLSASLVHGIDMDTNYVLIVPFVNGGFDVTSTATDKQPPYLLRMSDLKEGRTEKVLLDTTGITGGTRLLSAGRLSHGHIYMCNLAVFGQSQTLRIYHYTSPTATPEVKEFTNGQDGIPNYTTFGRFGDAMSVELDENGDGYIFLNMNRGSVPVPDNVHVLRLTVTNFSVGSATPLLVPTYDGRGYYGNYRQVDDATNEYIYTSHVTPIQLVNKDGGSIYTLDRAAVPLTGNDAKVVTFNRERYLVVQTGEANAVLNVYDITQGATTQEALELFDARENKTALYSFGLDGGSSVACLGVAKTENALYLMGASPGGGFAVIKAPKAVKAE